MATFWQDAHQSVYQSGFPSAYLLVNAVERRPRRSAGRPVDQDTCATPTGAQKTPPLGCGDFRLWFHMASR